MTTDRELGERMTSNILLFMTNFLVVFLVIYGITMTIIFAHQVRSIREDLHNIDRYNRGDDRGNDSCDEPYNDREPVEGEILPKG